MKKMLIIMLAGMMVFSAVACKKDKGKLPDGSDKVSEFATIPSFKAVFLALDKLETDDLNAFKQTSYAAAAGDTLRTAFAWGALVAEAQLAVASKNSGWLNAVMEQLKTLAPALGQQDLTGRLAQSVKPLIASGDWEKVKQYMYDLQAAVDKDLMDQKRYGEYTLSALGCWTETVNQIGGLIAANYSTEKSRVLNTRAWQDLADNLLLLDSAKLSEVFPTVQKLGDMMNTAGQNPLNPEQVSEVVTLTDSIRVVLRTP